MMLCFGGDHLQWHNIWESVESGKRSYGHDERYQLDATIVIYYLKYLYMFRASICPSSGVQVVCTAYGDQHCNR